MKKSSKASISAVPEQQPWATAHLNKGKQPVSVPGSELTASNNTNAPKERIEQNCTTTATATATASMAAVAELEGSDTITPLPSCRDVYIDPLGGHSNVTIPTRPSHRHAYSECIDLDDLEPGGLIRSPSGNILSAEEAAIRADRPMGIKERQEAIKRKVAEQSQLRMGNETTVVGDAKGKKQRERAKMRKRAKVRACFACHCQ